MDAGIKQGVSDSINSNMMQNDITLNPKLV
jgi:hypothetical protein